MKNLINGVINFRQKSRAGYCDKFSKLVAGQSPTALFITCCDSRVVPSVFTATDPGELFVLRNIGNLVPPYQGEHQHNTDNSVAAAIEFSIFALKVSDIIVCGHSECGAMSAVCKGQSSSDNESLKTWLKYVDPAYEKFQQGFLADSSLTQHNRLSQVNVAQQLDHLQTYPCVAERLQAGTLKIHGWWFDLETANTYHYDSKTETFVLIDEKEAAKVLVSIGKRE